MRARSGTGPPNRKRRPGQVAASFESGNGNAASIRRIAAARQPDSQRSAAIVADLERAMARASCKDARTRRDALFRIAGVHRRLAIMETMIRGGIELGYLRDDLSILSEIEGLFVAAMWQQYQAARLQAERSA
jgi:hypothetical protein